MSRLLEDELMGIGPSNMFLDRSRISMCGSEKRNDGRLRLILLERRCNSCRLLRFLNPADEKSVSGNLAQ